MRLRWDPCVVQDTADFLRFLAEYVDRSDRKCLVIGGAGFDPRATLIPLEFGKLSNCAVRGIFFREERIMDQPLLRPCADKNEADINKMIPRSSFPRIEVFSEGVTAAGGRRAIEVISQCKYEEFTDIFVDISALSCGVFFSIVRYLVESCDRQTSTRLNLHLLVAEQRQFDHEIRGIPSDSAAMLHGFKGERSLDTGDNEALLWIPTLSSGQRDSLTKIYQLIQRTETPIDICPIITFPGIDPRMPDRLFEEFREQLATWRADPRNFLYATESDPLDAYRSISALFASRSEVFLRLGGSRVVLSPLGNKMLSVGAMLAAIEYDLPVAMVESIGYDEAFQAEMGPCEGILTHVWLCGDAYQV